MKDPTHFEALVNYGVVLLHDGAYLYAAQTFKSAIAVSPPAGGTLSIHTGTLSTVPWGRARTFRSGHSRKPARRPNASMLWRSIRTLQRNASRAKL